MRKKAETVIGPKTSFKGVLICTGPVQIDGVCEEGLIKTDDDIIIGPQAKVAATLVAENVLIRGRVMGNIQAVDRLEILSTGRVWGQVEVNKFLLDDQGYFNGMLILKR